MDEITEAAKQSNVLEVTSQAIACSSIMYRVIITALADWSVE